MPRRSRRSTSSASSSHRSSSRPKRSNGKDIDKKAAEALKAIKADAGGQKSAMEARFNAAMTSLTQKLKTAPKPAAKPPAAAVQRHPVRRRRQRGWRRPIASSVSRRS